MVTFYSTGCPKCKILEAKLKEANIEYEKVTDIEEFKKLGIMSAPVLKVDDKVLPFGDAVRWVKNV
jgi:glutaredoxin-related protein